MIKIKSVGVIVAYILLIILFERCCPGYCKAYIRMGHSGVKSPYCEGAGICTISSDQNQANDLTEVTFIKDPNDPTKIIISFKTAELIINQPDTKSVIMDANSGDPLNAYTFSGVGYFVIPDFICSKLCISSGSKIKVGNSGTMITNATATTITNGTTTTITMDITP